MLFLPKPPAMLFLPEPVAGDGGLRGSLVPRHGGSAAVAGTSGATAAGGEEGFFFFINIYGRKFATFRRC